MAKLDFNHQPLFQAGDILKIKNPSTIPNPVFGWNTDMHYLFDEIFTVDSVEPLDCFNPKDRGEPVYHSVEGIENEHDSWLISEDMLELVSRPRKKIEIASDEEFELLLGVLS